MSYPQPVTGLHTKAVLNACLSHSSIIQGLWHFGTTKDEFFLFPLLGSSLPGAICLYSDISAAEGPVLALLICSALNITAERGRVTLCL